VKTRVDSALPQPNQSGRPFPQPPPPPHAPPPRQATLTTIVISTVKVGTSIDSFYAALKSYAGEATGLRVLDQAKAVANAVKVAQVRDGGSVGAFWVVGGGW